MTADSLDEFLATLSASKDGTHRAVVDTVADSTSQNNGKAWTVITFTVTDEENPIDGEEFMEFFEDFSHLSIAEYNELPATEKKKVRDTKERWRNRLTSLGVAQESLSNFKAYQTLVGTQVDITIETTNGKDDRKFHNIRNVALVTD